MNLGLAWECPVLPGSKKCADHPAVLSTYFGLRYLKASEAALPQFSAVPCRLASAQQHSSLHSCTWLTRFCLPALRPPLWWFAEVLEGGQPQALPLRDRAHVSGCIPGHRSVAQHGGGAGHPLPAGALQPRSPGPQEVRRVLPAGACWGALGVAFTWTAPLCCQQWTVALAMLSLFCGARRLMTAWLAGMHGVFMSS
jgi:hypothetical protein